MTMTDRQLTGSQGLEDKVALVTGGGRGLGEAVCRALSAAGMRVVAADIQHDLADRVASACGERAASIRLDVTDESDAEWCVRDVLAR